MRRFSLVIALAMATVLAGATLASAVSYNETKSRFFLRHDANEESTCGGEKYLSRTPGSGEPGCGYIGGAPLDELFITGTGEPLSSDSYSTTDGVPLILDANRELTGTMVIGADGVGAGAPGYDVEVTVTLPGTLFPTVVGTAEVRSDPNAYVLADAVLDFSIDIPDSLHQQEITKLTLTYTPRGLYANMGYHQKNGESFITVPSLEIVEE